MASWSDATSDLLRNQLYFADSEDLIASDEDGEELRDDELTKLIEFAENDNITHASREQKTLSEELVAKAKGRLEERKQKPITQNLTYDAFTRLSLCDSILTELLRGLFLTEIGPSDGHLFKVTAAYGRAYSESLKNFLIPTEDTERRFNWLKTRLAIYRNDVDLKYIFKEASGRLEKLDFSGYRVSNYTIAMTYSQQLRSVTIDGHSCPFRLALLTRTCAQYSGPRSTPSLIGRHLNALRIRALNSETEYVNPEYYRDVVYLLQNIGPQLRHLFLQLPFEKFADLPDLPLPVFCRLTTLFLYLDPVPFPPATSLLPANVIHCFPWNRLQKFSLAFAYNSPDIGPLLLDTLKPMEQLKHLTFSFIYGCFTEDTVNLPAQDLSPFLRATKKFTGLPKLESLRLTILNWQDAQMPTNTTTHLKEHTLDFLPIFSCLFGSQLKKLTIHLFLRFVIPPVDLSDELAQRFQLTAFKCLTTLIIDFRDYASADLENPKVPSSFFYKQGKVISFTVTSLTVKNWFVNFTVSQLENIGRAFPALSELNIASNQGMKHFQYLYHFILHIIEMSFSFLLAKSTYHLEVLKTVETLRIHLPHLKTLCFLDEQGKFASITELIHFLLNFLVYFRSRSSLEKQPFLFRIPLNLNTMKTVKQYLPVLEEDKWLMLQ